MWLMIMYDLPAVSKKEKSDAKKFRNNLLKDGFTMFQYSIYIRYCFSDNNANIHRRRIRKLLTKGHVGVIKLNDNQFKAIEVLEKRKNFIKTNIPELITFY